MLSVKAPAAGVAERKVDEDEAGDATLFDNVTGRPNHHGGDAGFFEISCSQAHGLVTHRSKRDE